MTLQEIRKSKGLTQKYVLDYLNRNGVAISKTSLSNKERGITPFTLEEGKYLCDLYGVEIRDVSVS